RSGMDDESRGLIDNQQVLVLENDPQWNVLRLVVRRLRFRDGEHESLVAAHFQGRVAQRSSGSLDGAASDQVLEPFSRQGRNGRCERTIEPPAGMGGLQAHLDRLNTPHLNKIWVWSVDLQ